MNRLNAVISALLLINGVFGIDFEIEYTPDSLTSNGWVNEGTLTGKDLNGLKGTVMPDVDGVNALCYDETKDIQSYIDYIAYNTHKSVNPELTMIIWIRPQPGYTPKNNDWLLGHDNGGYDRSIIVYDGRYKGIAMGVGRSYISTVSYPPAGKWTSITATFSENDKKATVYKNGGNDGQQQVTLSSDASGQSDIGLNGLRDWGNHNFVGCIGRVQIVNRVLSAQEVKDEYGKGIEAANDIANDICTYPQCSSHVALDIGFLMDESGSIDSAEWQTMVDFVERLIKWDINDISYITLIEYGSIDDFNQFLDFTQSTQSNKAAIINTLQNNQYGTGGLTYTKDAVERSLEIFTKWDIANDPNGERANLLFLLTDGEPTDTVCDDLANTVSLSNVDIVLIGIGEGLDAITWTDKLDCLYSDESQNAFYVSQFTEKEFNRIEGDLRDKTCQNKLNILGNNNAAMSPFKYTKPSSSYLWILRSELNSARKENQVLYVISFGLFILNILTCIGFIGFIYSSSFKQNKVVYSKTFENDPDQL